MMRPDLNQVDNRARHSEGSYRVQEISGLCVPTHVARFQERCQKQTNKKELWDAQLLWF